MGAGGIPSGGVFKFYGRSGDLPTKDSHINSRWDLYENGKKKQSRWFDSNGLVIRNRDYFHQNAHENHTFPHDHLWYHKGMHIDRHGNWSERLVREIEPIEPDYLNYPSDEKQNGEEV